MEGGREYMAVGEWRSVVSHKWRKNSAMWVWGDFFFFFFFALASFFPFASVLHSLSTNNHHSAPHLHPYIGLHFLSVLRTPYITISISHCTFISQQTHASDHPNTPHHSRKQLGLWPGMCGHGSQRFGLTSLAGRSQHALLW